MTYMLRVLCFSHRKQRDPESKTLTGMLVDRQALSMNTEIA